MIIKAVEALAQAFSEVSSTGMCDGLSIVLPEEQWSALERETHAAMLLKPSPSFMGTVERDSGSAEPTEFRLYTAGGEVTIRKASE